MAAGNVAHGQKCSSHPNIARAQNASGRNTVPTPASAKVGRPSGASPCKPRRSALSAVTRTPTLPSMNAALHNAAASLGRIRRTPRRRRAPATHRRTRAATPAARGARWRMPQAPRRRGRTTRRSSGRRELPCAATARRWRAPRAKAPCRGAEAQPDPGSDAGQRARADQHIDAGGESPLGRRRWRRRRWRRRWGGGGGGSAAPAFGLIISAITSAAACISSVQSPAESRRSPVRSPARVVSVSCQLVAETRRTLASTSRRSGGGATGPATRWISAFSASTPGQPSGATQVTAMGRSSGGASTTTAGASAPTGAASTATSIDRAAITGGGSFPRSRCGQNTPCITRVSPPAAGAGATTTRRGPWKKVGTATPASDPTTAPTSTSLA